MTDSGRGERGGDPINVESGRTIDRRGAEADGRRSMERIGRGDLGVESLTGGVGEVCVDDGEWFGRCGNGKLGLCGIWVDGSTVDDAECCSMVALIEHKI